MAKRTNGEGTINKRANGTWMGQIMLGYDENNKRIRRTVYGKTKKEVADKIRQLCSDRANGTYVDPSNVTVADWSKDWITNHLLAAKESTLYQYDQYLRLYVVPDIGSVPMQKVTPRMIQEIITNRFRDGLSAKTVRNLHGIIHHCFQDAVKMELIQRNPAEMTELPKVQKKEMTILDGEEIKAFLNVIAGSKYEDIYYTDLFCGFREGEILGLTWDCVDFKNKTITIRQQLKRDSKIGETNSQYVLSDTKTGNIRTIQPASSVFDVLTKVKHKQIANKLKYGSSYNNQYNLVFTNEIGEHISSRILLRDFKKKVTAIGKPEMRFHDLRHTYVSLSLQNGDDLKVVSANVGHTNISTTANIYAHLTSKMKSDSADRMEAFIRAL